MYDRKLYIADIEKGVIVKTTKGLILATMLLIFISGCLVDRLIDKLKKIDYTILKEVKNAKDSRAIGQRFELLSGKETQAVSEGERPRTETAIERQDRLVSGGAETKAGREAEVKPPEAKYKYDKAKKKGYLNWMAK